MAARRSEGGVNIKTKTKIIRQERSKSKRFTSSIVRYGLELTPKSLIMFHRYLSKTPSSLSSTQMWLQFARARARPICFIEKEIAT